MAERLITDSSLARATVTSFFRAQGRSLREVESGYRALGDFDEADMVRQLADGLERGDMPTDEEWADRGRPDARKQVSDG